MAMSANVPLDELRDLFTGVPAEDGGWLTAPCYKVRLALEIAKRCDTQSEFSLRTILFDSTAADDIPAAAMEAIKFAVQRYKVIRTVRPRGRTRGL